MKSRFFPGIVRDIHAYTRSRSPWLLDTCEEEKGAKPASGKFGRKLFHYISGGGMKSFGRTVLEEEANARRTRFLIGSLVLGIFWFVFFWV